MARYSASITGNTQLFVSSVVASANLDNNRDICLQLDRRQPSVVNNCAAQQQQGGPLWRRDGTGRGPANGKDVADERTGERRSDGPERSK